MKLLPYTYFCVDMFIHLNPRNIKTFPDLNVYLDFFGGGGGNLCIGYLNYTTETNSIECNSVVKVDILYMYTCAYSQEVKI